MSMFLNPNNKVLHSHIFSLRTTEKPPSDGILFNRKSCESKIILEQKPRSVEVSLNFLEYDGKKGLFVKQPHVAIETHNNNDQRVLKPRNMFILFRNATSKCCQLIATHPGYVSRLSSYLWNSNIPNPIVPRWFKYMSYLEAIYHEVDYPEYAPNCPTKPLCTPNERVKVKKQAKVIKETPAKSKNRDRALKIFLAPTLEISQEIGPLTALLGSSATTIYDHPNILENSSTRPYLFSPQEKPLSTKDHQISSIKTPNYIPWDKMDILGLLS